MDSKGRLENDSDTPKGKTGELTVARKVAIDHPAVMLLKQDGEEANGWSRYVICWPVIT